MKVVIIDDEYWTRESIRRLGNWERLGIGTVEEAEDGLSGLALIEEIRPDIVITDMKMRGIDGAELLRKMTEDYPFVRKIVISGFDDFTYTKQAILSRVDEYLLKPIDPGELNRAMEKAVRELRAARGVHAAQPLDREAAKLIAENKELLAAHFLELSPAEVRGRIEALEKALERRAPVGPGLKNLLYKQFMLLFGEQAAKAGIDAAAVVPERAASFFVTDDTPFEQLTGMLADSYAAIAETAMKQSKSRERIDIGQIRQFIDSTYAQPITLESVAARFFVSKEHLSRTFRQEMGMTVLDYITARRIEKATRLLRENSVSIKSAAEAVGYSDPAYFHRIFKKVTGLTPAQIRQET